MTSQPGDPRNTAEYRRNRALVLDASTTCWLCHHGGANTVDHIIPVEQWIAMHGTPRGVNAVDNLAPAHGTHRYRRTPCPTCGRVCNQSRGSRAPATSEPRSRAW